MEYHEYYPRLSTLGLDTLARVKVLEWYARKIFTAINEGSGDRDYAGKMYDPLTIEISSDETGVAHSYVFNFKDGGRHHVFHNLDELEDWLLDEAIQGIKYYTEELATP